MKPVVIDRHSIIIIITLIIIIVIITILITNIIIVITITTMNTPTYLPMMRGMRNTDSSCIIIIIEVEEEDPFTDRFEFDDDDAMR